MIYAMLENNRVIDVKESNKPPKYPPTLNGTEIIAVECDASVEIGMSYNPETNEFYWKQPELQLKPQPTQIDKIQESQLVTMEALADQYEENLQTTITMYDTLATIYETMIGA